MGGVGIEGEDVGGVMGGVAGGMLVMDVEGVVQEEWVGPGWLLNLEDPGVEVRGVEQLWRCRRRRRGRLFWFGKRDVGGHDAFSWVESSSYTVRIGAFRRLLQIDPGSCGLAS